MANIRGFTKPSVGYTVPTGNQGKPKLTLFALAPAQPAEMPISERTNIIRSRLISAIQKGHLETVQFLLSRANSLLKNSRVTFLKGNEAVLARIPNTLERSLPLFLSELNFLEIAVIYKQLDIVKYLVGEGFDCNLIFETDSLYSPFILSPRSAFILAVMFDCEEIIEFFLSLSSCKIVWGIFEIAIAYNRPEILDKILEKLSTRENELTVKLVIDAIGKKDEWLSEMVEHDQIRLIKVLIKWRTNLNVILCQALSIKNFKTADNKEALEILLEAIPTETDLYPNYPTLYLIMDCVNLRTAGLYNYGKLINMLKRRPDYKTELNTSLKEIIQDLSSFVDFSHSEVKAWQKDLLAFYLLETYEDIDFSQISDVDKTKIHVFLKNLHN